LSSPGAASAGTAADAKRRKRENLRIGHSTDHPVYWGFVCASCDEPLLNRDEICRSAIGGPLAAQQAVAHAIADLATELEAARLLVYAAAAAYDEGHDRAGQPKRAAMAKLYATEAAQRIIDGCLQLHGARALQSGHLLERLYRDVRALRIYEGASEIQRTIIARAELRETSR